MYLVYFFPVIILFFHVINYFKTAREHLNSNGLFVFDVWYAPCVLNEKPEKRERFLKEFQRYKIKWRAKLEKVDEYYNPNLRMDKEYFWINF